VLLIGKRLSRILLDSFQLKMIICTCLRNRKIALVLYARDIKYSMRINNNWGNTGHVANSCSNLLYFTSSLPSSTISVIASKTLQHQILNKLALRRDGQRLEACWAMAISVLCTVYVGMCSFSLIEQHKRVFCLVVTAFTFIRVASVTSHPPSRTKLMLGHLTWTDYSIGHSMKLNTTPDCFSSWSHVAECNTPFLLCAFSVCYV